MRWSWVVRDSFDRTDLALLHALESGQGEWIGGEPISCSRSLIQNLIEAGAVTLDGRALSKPGTKLAEGSRIMIDFPAPAPIEARPENLPIDILYEDADLVVVNKPPGLTVHPSETQPEHTLVNILLHHVKDLSGIGGALRPGIVHRIDKDTSGALVVTKSDRAHRVLTEVFARHEIERTYWALCYGALGEKSIDVAGHIGRNPADRKKMTTLPRGKGKKALTHLRQIEEYAVPGKKPFASWIEATLETGRTHQVRVHLTSIHHSILGDPKYGTPTSQQAKWLALPSEAREAVSALPGQALHARLLGFEHPITGKALRFEAEPPPAFARLLSELQHYRCQHYP